jgi:glycosyltransferase involved in cell wall biosynthesis
VKVLHITDDLVGISGVRSYLADLVEMLPASGFTGEAWGPNPTLGHFSDHLTRWASRRYERELRSRLRRDRPAILHAHNLWMRLSPLPLRAAKSAAIPVVMTLHDYNNVCPRKWMITAGDRACESGFGGRCLVSNCRGSREGWPWLPYNNLRWLKVALHRQMLKTFVDVFICPSNHLASWVRRNMGIDNVVHLANFTRPPAAGTTSTDNPQRILFAGRLSREKGVDILIRAVAILVEDHPRASLVIAGDGPEEPKLRRQVSALGLEDSVSFAGSLAGEGLTTQYREAGICVLPTLWMENCPISVLESFSNGRPMVATRIGGIPELVEEGLTGFLFQRADHRDLAAKLGLLCNDATRVIEMGRHAAEAFEQKYTANVHLKRLSSIYNNLINRDGPESCSAAH